MYKPISNPYIVGNPIRTSDMFFGRQDDFQFIKRKLETGDKSYIFVICGERRSGKTSILFQILSGRLGESFIPILVDMQTMAGLKNEIEFFVKFAEETQKHLKIKTDLDKYFKTSDSSFNSFTKFLNDIYTKHDDKHILFLIDEYELIETKISEGSLNENFIPYLAGLLESDMRLSFIFTGSTKLEERKNKMWQILFAKSLFRNVSYLSRDDTLRLIQEPVKGSIDYNVESLNIIYRLTAGQPFYTQVVCQNIVDYVNQTQNNQIQEENLEIIINEILENPLPQMIYFWNSQSDDKKLIFSLLAELLEKPNEWITAVDIIKQSKQRKFGLTLSEKSINMTMEALFHSQHLSKSPSGYKFQMDLFRRWIKRDHAIWRVMKEVSSLGMASSIEHQVYNDEEESFEKKSNLKFVYISVVIILLIVAGWWFFKPSSESEKTFSNNTLPIKPKAKDPDKVKEKQLPSNTSNKDNVQYDEPESPADNRKETDAKNSVMQNDKPGIEKRPVQTKQTTTRHERIDTGKDDADHAKSNSETARRTAIGMQADKLVVSQFNEAKSKENDAIDSYQKKDYRKAETEFKEAAQLYVSASNHANVLGEDKAAADEAKSRMDMARNKLSIKHQTMQNYKHALQLENEGNALYDKTNYQEASQKYQSAENAFENTTTEYENNVRRIYKIINEYLDAIQDENIAEMKKSYANFNADLQKAWSQVFDVASDMNVTRKIKSIDFQNDVDAFADVDVKLDFKGNQNNTLNNWQFKMKKSGTNWIIFDINEGN
ncbi:MAG: AAA-like domain-containing protein [Calditrichaceae bacterium]